VKSYFVLHIYYSIAVFLPPDVYLFIISCKNKVQNVITDWVYFLWTWEIFECHSFIWFYLKKMYNTKTTQFKRLRIDGINPFFFLGGGLETNWLTLLAAVFLLGGRSPIRAPGSTPVTSRRAVTMHACGQNTCSLGRYNRCVRRRRVTLQVIGQVVQELAWRRVIITLPAGQTSRP